jgi:hypothetical protein
VQPAANAEDRRMLKFISDPFLLEVCADEVIRHYGPRDDHFGIIRVAHLMKINLVNQTVLAFRGALNNI